ncbi:RpiR family transcriptional regulator [Mesorhizobium sp. J18]|uniref:MurR/RpiR family transcriptional regulator n=1 Tax=Mesorhizobium sp. J18 TaxID=935263 RepID=UPI001198CDF9|nr:MurR/RpiR family transcriptional regulator [Mesorhizobium sp. J18]TWG98260.1 RpiR family transcriptional regulator [Mesorhizobium sp. J18]
MDAEDRMERAPRDFEALRGLILNRRKELPKRLAQVAVYALDHPEEVAFGTAASIAQAADVQPSTLVRFAQHLGFDGFSDLQGIFRNRLKERTGNYEERLATIRATTKQGSEDIAILNGFLGAASQSIDKLVQTVNPLRFERATALLADAETIYLIARRRSYPIAAYLAYAFGKMKLRYVLTGSMAGLDPEMLAMATERDAAIAVSFSPYAPSTIEQARQLGALGVPVVSITDNAFSPLAECAEEWLEVAEADFAGFRSLSASMALCMALSVAVAERRRRHAAQG